MSNHAIYQAMRTRLNDLPSLPPVAYENRPYTPTTGVLWLSESFLPADIDPLTLSDGQSQEYNGIYQITVFAPADDDSYTGMAKAEAIALHFKRGTVIGQGRVLAVSINQAIVGNGWYQVPVTVQYRAHYSG